MLGATTHVDPETATRSRHTKWWYGPKGTLWKLANRENRNAYHRRYYQQNIEERRAYLNAKQREYRGRGA